MKKDSKAPSGLKPSLGLIAGWFFLIALGAGLVVWGFVQSGRDQSSNGSLTVTIGVTPSSTSTSTLIPVSTNTPKSPPTPSLTPSMEPTPSMPPTPLPTATPSPLLTVGVDGVNVRLGPGTHYKRVGYLEPGTEVVPTGYYGDWWQIVYEGKQAWIYGDLVTASNTDQLTNVKPPPSPTPQPATPTPVPTPTSIATQPPSDYRGIQPDKFEVEGAPGPYALGQDIWFHMWLTNKTSSPVEYEYLGVQVEENGKIQKSWTYSKLPANQQFHWRDRLQGQISSSGTYHLWLVIGFRDGTAYRLLGPVEVVVQ